MFCKYCGHEMNDNERFCTNCGNYVNDNPIQNQAVDSGSFGWAVLGFLIPIVGLILFLVWRNTKPKSAKMAGIGAIVGFCINILLLPLI